MSRDEIELLFSRRDDALDRRDLATLASLHAPDCVLQSPMAGTVYGPEAIADVWGALFIAFPDLVILPEELIVDGDRIAQVSLLVGTDTGGFMGLPPTGKPIKLPVVTLFRVRDDHIVDVRPIYDFTGLLVQIGLLKARPA